MSINGPLGATPETGAFELTTTTRARVSAVGSRAGNVALLVVVGTVLVLCLGAVQTNILLPESVRPVEPAMAGPFGALSFHLPVVPLLLALTSMFAAYVIAVRRADRISPRSVLMAVAAVNALVVLAPPLFSTDVFSYQAYARIWATYGSNPYLHGPYAISLDPVYHYIGSKWIFTPSVYGPLFTVLSGLLAPVSVALSAVTFKAVAALSSIATITLIWHGARLRGLDPVRAVALFGLNPLVVVYGVGGGHNDLLMLVLATAGIHALLAHRERMSGAMIVLATGIKLTGGVLLPFALASGAKLGAPTRRRKLLTGAGVAGAAVAVAGFAAFGGGVLNLLPTLQRVQAAGDWHSIPGFITTVFGVGSIGRLAGVLLGVAFVGVTAWLLRRVWRGEMDWIDGVGWATLAMLVTASSILPWYVCWLLPPVALCTDRRLWKASLVLSGVILFTTMLGYVPFGVSLFGMRLVP